MDSQMSRRMMMHQVKEEMAKKKAADLQTQQKAAELQKQNWQSSFTAFFDFSTAKPIVDLVCDPHREDSVKHVAMSVCPWLGSDISQLSVRKVTGGHTNWLRQVSGNGRTALVRVHGPITDVINRDIENPTFEALAKWLGRPAYLGQYTNGRVEEFLEGFQRVTICDVGHPNRVKGIATELAHLHQFQTPSDLAPHHKVTAVWDNVYTWFAEASNPKTVARWEQGFESHLAHEPVLNMKRLGAMVNEAERRIKSLGGRICFCHNKLTPGDILLNEKTGEVRLVDLEYVGYNYAAFDVANHFMNYAGGECLGTQGRPEYERLPSIEIKRLFVRYYLGAATNEISVEAFLNEVHVFEVFVNLYWGLWGITMAHKYTGTAAQDFPYFLYGIARLKRAFHDAGETHDNYGCSWVPGCNDGPMGNYSPLP